MGSIRSCSGVKYPQDSFKRQGKIADGWLPEELPNSSLRFQVMDSKAGEVSFCRRTSVPKTWTYSNLNI